MHTWPAGPKIALHFPSLSLCIPTYRNKYVTYIVAIFTSVDLMAALSTIVQVLPYSLNQMPRSISHCSRIVTALLVMLNEIVTTLDY